MNIFLFAILTTLVFASDAVKNYKRMVVYSKNVNTVTNTVENVRDPHHTRAINILYSPVEASYLLPNATNWFLFQFGLNFTGGNYSATTDSWSIPGGTMIPFITGSDNKTTLDFDDEDLQIGKSGSWILLTAGHVVVLSGNGVFPGGVMAGKTYTNGDLLGCHEQNHLDLTRAAEWRVPGDKGRRKWFIRSEYPSRQLANSFGRTETFTKDLILDDQLQRGFSVGSVVSIPNGDGSFTQSTRNVITFN
ncbi:Hypothetical protein POVR1_LOCUS220 [uncultured virus]|nr:Hypothetical protein POVR1_LOCUS220 [uncultured virus]